MKKIIIAVIVIAAAFFVINRSKNSEIFAKKELPVPAGMISIPAKDSVFTMRIQKKPPFYWDGPKHQTVQLSEDFFMDTTEITQGLFEEVMTTTTYHFVPKKKWVKFNGISPKLPAYNVTWYEAILFCNARSILEGREPVYEVSGTFSYSQHGVSKIENVSVDYSKNGFRLPTEAEWEYACRAGTKGDFFWGEDYAGTHYRYNWEPYVVKGHSRGTSPVATKAPNGFGLYDMIGNSWEWCNDWYSNYDTSATLIDPTGPEYASSGSVIKILRGGSTANRGSVFYYRSGIRYFEQPKKMGVSIGFRTVCSKY